MTTLPLYNTAKLRVGEVRTDGETVALSAMGSPWGAPALSFQLAAVNALGAMPPILLEDWVNGIARTLREGGYSVSAGPLARLMP